MPTRTRKPLHGHHSRHGRLVVVTEAVANGVPITRVYGDRESAIFLDADAPEDGNDHDPETLVVLCLDCLTRTHPEAREGFALAREHVAAHVEDGVWMVGE
jgi:hypothetical protein